MEYIVSVEYLRLTHVLDYKPGYYVWLVTEEDGLIDYVFTEREMRRLIKWLKKRGHMKQPTLPNVYPQPFLWPSEIKEENEIRKYNASCNC